MPAHRLDLTNQRFGALTALEIVGSTIRGAIIWRCRCDCGVEREAVAGELKAGQITHCGCQKDGNRNLKQPRKLRKITVGEVPIVSSTIDFYLRSYRHG